MLTARSEPSDLGLAVLWNIVRGQWLRVDALLAPIQNPLAPDTPASARNSPALVQDAREGRGAFVTFALIAQRKKGHLESEQRFVREVLPELISADRWDLALVFAIEAAASAMNQGEYQSALARLDGLQELLVPFHLENGSLSEAPLFWQWRALIVRGLSNQALGRYAETQKALSAQGEMLSQFPFQDLSWGLARRKLSFLIEQERYTEAARFHDGLKSLVDGIQSGFVRSLWLVDSLRLSLALLDGEAAQKAYTAAQASLVQEGLPRTYVNLTQEEAELELCWLHTASPNANSDASSHANSHANSKVAMESIVKAINAGEAQVSLDSYCALRLLQAETLSRLGRLQDALIHLEVALAVAERHRFGRLRIRLLLLTWVLHQSLGFEASAQETAHKLLRDPLLNGLPLHKACCAAVSLCERSSSPKPLAIVQDLLAQGIERGVLCAWLNRYGLIEALNRAGHLLVVSPGNASVAKAQGPFTNLLDVTLRALVVSRRGRECGLICRGELTSCFVPARRKVTSAHTLFFAFLENARHELTSQRILRLTSLGGEEAKLRYMTAYDADRVRQAISRLRVRLASEGIDADVEFFPERAVYRLRPRWGVTVFLEEGDALRGQEQRFLGSSTSKGKVIKQGRKSHGLPGGLPLPDAKPRRGRPRVDITPREREIAQVAKSLGSFVFSTIHAQFRVRRQTLHHYLAKLVARGSLAHEKRGRGSRYNWVGEKS